MPAIYYPKTPICLRIRLKSINFPRRVTEVPGQRDQHPYSLAAAYTSEMNYASLCHVIGRIPVFSVFVHLNGAVILFNYACVSN